jgi:hypothetical protein
MDPVEQIFVFCKIKIQSSSKDTDLKWKPPGWAPFRREFGKRVEVQTVKMEHPFGEGRCI